ncbi:MAG: NAD(P)/FAD-dependent oxidoreductase [Candidatus Eremiobacteraeota bacterium]|nr:NAD(P)/FAD-dependent oxidoreductase [Candidatus Eremiobacteraeota bacterium]
MYDAVVIGAGHNGLACAALLAKSGLSVAVFEQSEKIGGAAVTELLWNGYSVSAAAYVCGLLDPWLIAELQLDRHGYSAYRKDPATFTVLEGGRSLLLGSDEAENEREIAAFNRTDVEGYREADRVIRRLGAELFETFSDEDPQFERFSPRTQALLRGSAAEIVERYVDTPVLQAAIATDGIIGTYLGPRDPGTGYVLAHHHAGRALGSQGAWGYVRGGMGAISTALASAAIEAGAEIFTAVSVQKIATSGGSARGVVLADGRTIAARAVVSNAHPRTTFLTLVGDQEFQPAFIAKVRTWKTTGCALKLNLALGELPNFVCRPGTLVRPHHRASIHVAPSLGYLQTAFEDAMQMGVSKEPMLECFLQTSAEPALAPKGKHMLSVFAQYYSYDRVTAWSSTEKRAAVDGIIKQLAQFAPNIPGAVEAMQVLSPVDLENRFGMIGGHIFHGELVPEQIYEHRFATRTPLQNLYLCGSGAHPGGCVSGFPGKRAAISVLRAARAASLA